MSFSDLVSFIDDTILDTFSDDRTIVLHDTSVGGASYTVPLIVANPTLGEDYIPGSAQGVGTLSVFVRFADAGSPLNGWTATLTGIAYDVTVGNPDPEGGVILKLRRRGQAWNR